MSELNNRLHHRPRASTRRATIYRFSYVLSVYKFILNFCLRKSQTQIVTNIRNIVSCIHAITACNIYNILRLKIHQPHAGFIPHSYGSFAHTYVSPILVYALVHTGSRSRLFHVCWKSKRNRNLLTTGFTFAYLALFYLLSTISSVKLCCSVSKLCTKTSNILHLIKIEQF